MSHIANHRIKKNGKYYAAGDPIELTEDELAELPEGAVREADPETATGPEDLGDTPDVDEALEKAARLAAEQFATVRAAVLELPVEAFKKDGDIRADALRDLNEKLGLELTAHNVAVAKTSKE